MAFVVGTVLGSQIFTGAGQAGLGGRPLMAMTGLYLCVTLFMYFGGSTFAGTSMWAAALAPVSFFKMCSLGDVDGLASAAGPYPGLRRHQGRPHRHDCPHLLCVLLRVGRVLQAVHPEPGRGTSV